jgi:hypothetical protein
VRPRSASTAEILQTGNVGRQSPYPQNPNPEVTDTNAPVTPQYLANQMAAFNRKLDRINMQLFDTSHPFDFYRPQSLSGEAATQIQAQASYSQERIESIIVTGPTGDEQTGLNAYGLAAEPVAAGTVITSLFLPQGAYALNLFTGLSGTATAADADNMELVIPGQSPIVIPNNVETVSSAQPSWSPVINVVSPPGGETIQIKSIGAGSGTANYRASIIANPSGNGTPFSLQLGGRNWNLLLPATGILVIPLITGFELAEEDPRILSSAVSGDWSIELMGHANTQYREQ